MSVTTLPFLRNRRVRDFGGPAELKAAMLASACAIPITPVWLPQAGAWCIDGAVSDLKVWKGILLGRRFTSLHQVEGAVSVSPFYASRATIAPSAFVPPWWGAYPPPPEDLKWLFALGRRDAVAWLDAQGRLPPHAAAAAAGDGPDTPPPPGAPAWRAALWEVRHVEGRAARHQQHLRRSLPAVVVRVVWVLVALELVAALCACGLAVAVGPWVGEGITAGGASR